ncbi:MAG: hypothetical protein ACREMH_08175 [Gemmatimonadales bacterium]
MTDPTPPYEQTAAPESKRRSRWKLWLLGTLLTIVLLFALYVWATLNWAYSDGERAGVLQKFSRKGWLCKTWEGELALYVVGGVAPQIWHFSVRDEGVVQALREAVGKRVQIHYTEHRGVPTSCFGDTNHFGYGITVLDDRQAAP